MSVERWDEVVFQHMIDLPSCDCVFCSTREKETGRTRLYLIFNERRRIYVRNGIRDAWDEVQDEQEYRHVRARFDDAIVERKIPCFSTAMDGIKNSEF